MHIAVDLDDVVLDHCVGLAQSVTTEFGFVPGVGGPEWHPSQFARTPEGLETFNKLGLGNFDQPDSWFAKRDWIWAGFPAVPGAIQGLQRLRDAGHHLELMTKRPIWAEWTVWKWLGRWRPPVTQVTIVPYPDGKKSQHTDADLLVDDGLDNCNDFLLEDREAILFIPRWNISFSSNPNRLVARGWSNVTDIIRRLND